MNLRTLYLLRIAEIEVYLNLLQVFLKNTRNFIQINLVLRLQDEYYAERKNIRRLLNLIELEKFF